MKKLDPGARARPAVSKGRRRRVDWKSRDGRNSCSAPAIAACRLPHYGRGRKGDDGIERRNEGLSTSPKGDQFGGGNRELVEQVGNVK